MKAKKIIPARQPGLLNNIQKRLPDFVQGLYSTNIY